MKVGQPITIKIDGFHKPYITPPIPPLNEIDGYDLPKKDQKWRRPILPDDDEILEYSESERDELIYRETKRRIYGHWVFINGEPTYLTGDYYTYLTYWFIGAETEGGLPEYRRANRIWEYVADICENDPNCYGMIALCQKRDGKALSLDTDIPTPSGWKKMKDIQEGDIVFGSDGKPTKVTFVSDIQYNRDCYEIVFSDGLKVIADAEHRWVASNAKDRACITWKRGLHEGLDIPTQEVKTIDFYNTTKSRTGYNNWSIQNCLPVEYPKKELKIPPYILGIWLGDGSSYYSKITNVDNEIISAWIEYGISIGMQMTKDEEITYMLTSGKGGRINPFMNHLRSYNLVKNKHIPEDYLQSSYEDRLELLKGLMDTDGCKNKRGNTFEYCSKLHELINNIYELVVSLGFKATVTTKTNKRYNKQYYYIRFGGYDINPFKISRKYDSVSKQRAGGIRQNLRYVTSVTKVHSVPVKCIQVDNKTHTYLCTKSFLVTHNTERAICKIWNRATTLDSNRLFTMQSLTATEAKDNLFIERLMRSHTMIPNYLKPVSNETKSKREIVGKLTFKGENVGGGKYKQARNNIIDHLPTKANAIQGKKPRIVFLDEPGSVEEMDLKVWWSTTKQQLALGPKIKGKAYLPTTLESMSPKGAPIYKSLWDDSDPDKIDDNGRTVSGLYRYFKPFYLGREGFIDEFGNDMVEEAKKFRENELKNASSEDQRKLKRQYPASTDEAFDVIAGSFWEEDVKDILKDAKSETLKLKPNLVICNLYEINGEIKWTHQKDEDQYFRILEMPKPGVKYSMGIDGTATDKETGPENGSKFAVVVMKGFDPEGGSYTPVAWWCKRPEKMEDGYRSSYLLAKFFSAHGAKGFVRPERNASQIAPIVAYYGSKNAKYLLTETSKGKYGDYVTDDVKDYQKNQANMLLRSFGSSYRCLQILEDAIPYSGSNATGKREGHLTDAMLQAIMNFPNFNKPVKVETTKEAQPKRMYFKNGRYVWE